MKKQIHFLLFLLFISFPFNSNAQYQTNLNKSNGGEYDLGGNNASYPCITSAEYAFIDNDCAKNIKKLGLPFKTKKEGMTTLLNWPLKLASGIDDCSYYVISANVDQDFAAGTFKDYNCGTNTYDGHKGTDIATFPFGIYKIDHDQVQVIAAAAGTIISKTDGNFDKNCATNNLTANSIAIQHADGSTTLYLHMKKNSLTSKGVGSTVAVGEFLGIVGSSGNSSGPHLHFEVWSGSTSSTYVDPFSGTCNSLNSSSYWVTQKPYTEPSVIKTSVNTTDIVVPGCPTTETPNESNCYTIPFQGPGLPAGYAKFYIFLRNETPGKVANMSIINPDGSTYLSWVYNSNSSYNASYRNWSKVLPTVGGTYTFRASYNGLTCEKKFDIVNAVISANSPTTICQGASVTLQASTAKSYFWSNGDTTQNINVSVAGDYKVTITNAYGCTSISNSINVKVNPVPIAIISPAGPTTFCEGTSLLLSSSQANSYIWSTGETTQNINVNSSGSYKVTVTNTFGCSASSSPINVTVNQNPVAIITPDGPTNFCEGNSLNLSSSLAKSYLWNTGDTTKVIYIKSPGDYKVTVTNNYGCSAVSNAISVMINPNPVATISPDGSTVFCEGGMVKLLSSTANSYIWSTGAKTQTINVNLSGTYTVSITDQNGCQGFASVEVTVNSPINNLPIKFKNDSLVSPYGSPASWFFGNNPIPFNNNTIIKCDKNGTYFVTGPDINGCIAQSDTITVKCKATSTQFVNHSSNFSVFPNPFNDQIHISGIELDNDNYFLSMLNSIGQIVLQKEIKIDSNTIDHDLNLGYLPDGIYLLFIRKGVTSSFIKVVKR